MEKGKVILSNRRVEKPNQKNMTAKQESDIHTLLEVPVSEPSIHKFYFSHQSLVSLGFFAHVFEGDRICRRLAPL